MGKRPDSRYLKEGKRAVIITQVMVISGNGYVVIIAFFQNMNY